MKNISSALLLAAFICANAAAYVLRPGSATPLTFALTLPLAVIALNIRKTREPGPRRFAPESPASFFPYVIAMVSVFVFTYFVYWKTTSGSVTFLDPIMQGWLVSDGLLLMLVSAAAAASALTIWSSNLYNRSVSERATDRLLIPEVFFAGRGEMERFGIFFSATLFLWALAVLSLRIFIRNWALDYLFISMARAAIPLMLLLVSALLGLPLAFAAALTAGGCYFMASRVVGFWLAALFTFAPLALLFVALAARYISVGTYLPFVPRADTQDGKPNDGTG